MRGVATRNRNGVYANAAGTSSPPVLDLFATGERVMLGVAFTELRLLAGQVAAREPSPLRAF